MTDAIIHSSSPVALPTPRVAVTVRPGTPADIPFMDSLQKIHTHMVGWMPTKQFEGKIALGHVIIAMDEHKQPIGYCIGNDQYSGRDDLGIIYQLNVLPMKQRSLIGATLIKAMFDRAAYGCRLFCCWCAQDIQANYFWESIGFIPLAFRTGSRAKQRIHIFWQRRIRENDTTTPYWFPSQTKAGLIREDRLVLPIPIGTSWRDAKPLILPGTQPGAPEAPKPKALPPTRPPAEPVKIARKMAVVRSQSRHLQGLPPGKAAVVTAGGIRYVDRGDYIPEVAPEPVKPKREPKPKAKNDPTQVRFVRELRDRFLEHINSDDFHQLTGKYDVSRSIEQTVSVTSGESKALVTPAPRLLPAA